jgi:hypothetical protein
MIRPAATALFAFLLAACGRDSASPAAPAGTSATAQAANAPSEHFSRNEFYQCGDVPLSLEYRGDGTLTMMLEDRIIVLQAVPGSAGVAFADADGNQFRKQDGVTLVLSGQSPRVCTPI